MNITKKKTTLLALALIAVFAIGFVAGWKLAPTQIYVTVEEAITVEPASVAITMKPSETKTAEFSITNIASNPISLTIDVHLVPENATYAEFFELVYESPFTAEPGTTPYTVSVTASPSIEPGTYIFEVTWER